jgi:hypothetical protein
MRHRDRQHVDIGGSNDLHHSERGVVTDLNLDAREHSTTVSIEPVDDDERSFNSVSCGDGHSPRDLHERTVQSGPYISRRPIEDRSGWRTHPKRRVPECGDSQSILGVQDSSLTAVVADQDGCLRPHSAHQSLQLSRQLIDGDLATRRAWAIAAQFELFDTAVTPDLLGLPGQLRSRELLPRG